MSDKKTRKDLFDYLHPFTSKYVKPLVDFFRAKPLYFVISIILLFLIILLSSFILKSVVITSLIILGGFSKIYQKYTHIAFGFELVMFSTIVSSYLYGPVVGVLVGVSSYLLAVYLTMKYTIHAIPSIIVYVLAAILTPLFSNVTLAGIVFSIIFVASLSLTSLILTLSRPDRTLVFAVTNLAWNLWVFVFLAPRIVDLLS